MNIREQQIIEALIDREDVIRHNKALEILFHGTYKEGKFVKNGFVNAVENAVRQCFSGTLYRGRFEEIYVTFETEFYKYLTKVKPETLRSIDKLENWLYIASRNFANSHRKHINEALGIVETEIKSDICLDRGTDAKPQDDEDSFNDIVDEKDSSAWAEDLLNRYIDRISCEYYRLILRAVVLEEMPREEFAQEQGKKDAAAIDRDVRRAKLELIKVAMSDIKWRSRKVMNTYGCLISKETDRLLLEDFFNGRQISDTNALATAISNLMKIAHREAREDEAEERREKRESRKQTN